ncbi:MAG: Rne/Rng family ribonuclease [Gammaproteobacteria bacterium]|nr:Rne/Rng family ribonuclease [Gammaproteobacteria bacterium]
MTETILVNCGVLETRVAVLANNNVQDLHIERGPRRSIVGNIYRGKVVRILPGMQAAFVDFGAERTGFLHVSALAGGKGGTAGRREPAIASELHDGQELMVQVARDPLGSKGARLTTDLSLSSRLLVFMPRSAQLAVSQRIDDAGERTRLLLALQEALAAEGLVGNGQECEGGYILRTAAEGVDAAGMRAELRFLQRLWDSVRRRSREATGLRILHEDLPLHLRVARDLAVESVERILVDDPAAFVDLREFCQEYVPGLVARLQLYDPASPLFEQYGVEEEIQRALGPRVELASGGHLVIEQTEAMTTIDVNTGAFVGRRDAEETVYRTNLEAASTLARQLRLRNLGGIIMVDFIDMAEAGHRRQLQDALRQALQADPVRTTFNGMSELGLVALTRKRNGESLQHILCVDCPVCSGSGALKSVRTVSCEIFRQVSRAAVRCEATELVVLAAPQVVNLLQGEESASLAELERTSGKTIRLRAEPLYSQEHFDIATI